MSAGTLISIAVGAVAFLLVLIIQFRVHVFVALILVSFLTALVTGIPAGNIVTTLTSAFGSTLGGVALLVGLGAMLGRLLEVSGGAQVLADDLVRRFGEKRAPLALGIASLFFGFPIFFDAGLVVMFPVVFTVGRRLGGSLLLYGIPVATAFSVMHVFVPPHPGPVAAAELLNANVGLLIIVGLLVAIPTWIIAGHFFGKLIGAKINLTIPENSIEHSAQNDGVDLPRAGLVVALLVLPLNPDFPEYRSGLCTSARLGKCGYDMVPIAPCSWLDTDCASYLCSCGRLRTGTHAKSRSHQD